jgi:hypothetical protein
LVLLLALPFAPVSGQAPLPPTPADDFTTTDEESSVYTFVVANDTDPDGTVIPTTISLAGSFANGTALLDNLNGAIVYVPDTDFNGWDSIRYRICDNSGLCATAQLFVDVLPVNDDPVAVRDVLFTEEDATAVLFPAMNDSDPQDPLGGIDITSIQVIDSFRFGHVVAGTASFPGSLIYRPDLHFNGADSMRYRVCDIGNPLPRRCAEAWFRVEVVPVNDAPVWVDLPDLELPTCLEPVSPWAGVSLWDVDGDPLRLTITATSAGVELGDFLSTDANDQADWRLEADTLRSAFLGHANLGYALRRIQLHPHAVLELDEWPKLRLRLEDVYGRYVEHNLTLRPDAFDPTACDADRDGWADAVECPSTPCDLDGDGLANYEDKDADGDGIKDADFREAGDCQNNGIPDFLDPETCKLSVPGYLSMSSGQRLHLGGIARYPNSRLQVIDPSGRVVLDAQPYRNTWQASNGVSGLHVMRLWLDAAADQPDYHAPLMLLP